MCAECKTPAMYLEEAEPAVCSLFRAEKHTSIGNIVSSLSHVVPKQPFAHSFIFEQIPTYLSSAKPIARHYWWKKSTASNKYPTHFWCGLKSCCFSGLLRLPGGSGVLGCCWEGCGFRVQSFSMIILSNGVKSKQINISMHLLHCEIAEQVAPRRCHRKIWNLIHFSELDRPWLVASYIVVWK